MTTPQGEILEEIQKDIASLELCDTDELQQIAASLMYQESQDLMEELTYLQKIRPLTHSEQDKLEEIILEYGHVMLLKARAFALLADRGYPLPDY